MSDAPTKRDTTTTKSDGPTRSTVILVLWLLGVAVVVALLAMRAQALPAVGAAGAVRAPWWALFAAGMVAETMVVRMRIGSNAVGMSANEVAVVAGLLLAPPHIGVPAVAGGIVTTLLLRTHDAVVKRLFNAATAVVSTSIAFLALPLLAPPDLSVTSVSVGLAAMVATLAGTVLGNAHLLLAIRTVRGDLPAAAVRTVGMTTLVAVAVTSVALPGVQLVSEHPQAAWIAVPATAAFLGLLTVSGLLGERLSDVEVQVGATEEIAAATSSAALVSQAHAALARLLGADVTVLVLHDQQSGWEAHWRVGDDGDTVALTADETDAVRLGLRGPDALPALLRCGVPALAAREVTQVVDRAVPLRGGRNGLAIVGRNRRRLARAHDGKLVASIASLVATGTDRLDLIRTLSRHLSERVHRASHDELTGALNRNAFEEATAVQSATRELVTVLAVDLDGFGTVNRVLGQEAGDAILRLATDRLQHLAGEEAIVARLGNDEFGVLVPPGLDAETAAIDVANLFEEPLLHDGVPIDVPVHVGYASARSDQGVQPRDLLRRATVALSSTRSTGRQIARWQPELDDNGEQLLATATSLRRALRDGQLQTHFQPQVRLSDGVAVGMEALVRWTDPELGPVHPEVFVPIAEQTGLIDELTLQVLETALATWASIDPLVRPSTVSINVSPRVLVDEDLPTSVAIALARHEVPASALIIEVTESTELHEDRRADRVLQSLKELGVGIALDDYGTGYASMGALRRIQADELKIDRSFVAAAPNDHSSAAIVQASVALASTLNLRSVAEGIERLEDAQRLYDLGCDIGQGWLWSKALPADALVTWLHERAIEQALRDGDRAAAEHAAGKPVASDGGA